MDDSKRFWAALGSLVTVFGGVLVANQRDLEREFLLIVVIALLVAFGPTLGRRVTGWFAAVRAYQPLLRRVADLENELQSNKADIDFLHEERAALIEFGRKIGQDEFYCALVGNLEEGEVPRLTAVVQEGRSTSLMAEYTKEAQSVTVGMRFIVEDANTGQSKGIVQIRMVDPSRSEARLACIAAHVPEFWERLAHHAHLDSSIPQGIALAPLRLDRDPGTVLEPPIEFLEEKHG